MDGKSTHTGEYISRGIRKNTTKWSIKWYIFVQTRKSNPHWLGLSAQNMEFSVKYFEIDATSDPKSRNSVAVSYICRTLRFNEVSIHLCRLDFMSVLPSHAPSNLVAEEEHLHLLVIDSRCVICLYIDVDMDKLSSAARLFDTSSFMRIIHFIIINGHPTSGLAIHLSRTKLGF